jgi:hypothetical protein
METTQFVIFLITFMALVMVIQVIAAAAILYYLAGIRALLTEQTRRPDTLGEEQLDSGLIADINRQISAIPPPVGADILTGSMNNTKVPQSIQEQVAALGKKYSLTSLTLATPDGLSIGSTRSDPQAEAAEYSYLFLQGKEPEDIQVKIIGVPHKGNTVVGIIRSAQNMPPDVISMLEGEVSEALRQWL